MSVENKQTLEITEAKKTNNKEYVTYLEQFYSQQKQLASDVLLFPLLSPLNLFLLKLHVTQIGTTQQ